MSRAARLLDLLQELRNHRAPVSGRVLAEALGVSLRTIYRDIATLQAEGADIAGEAGLGYVLRPGFMLPPLMFSDEEIEALVLGSRWVARRADPALSAAARQALAKIAAVLPADLRAELDATPLLVGPGPAAESPRADLAAIRDAIRRERRLAIRYRDEKRSQSERVIWPFAIGFFDAARIVVAWCEMRAGFRHFRTDRLLAHETLGERYPRRRSALLRAWKAEQGIRPT